MKITFISDTHTFQHFIEKDIPADTDILIHCGDLSMNGAERECTEAVHWFKNLPYKHKVFIAGNHDFLFETVPTWINDRLNDNTHYLNDSGITIEGIKIWGSPVQPWFFNWAFNRHRGDDIKKHWHLIPWQTDILITHGPPFAILDQTKRGENVGCVDLLNTVRQIKPKIHAFGHIHEGYGKIITENTTFINASVLDENYFPKNKPITIDYNL